MGHAEVPADRLQIVGGEENDMGSSAFGAHAVDLQPSREAGGFVDACTERPAPSGTAEGNGPKCWDRDPTDQQEHCQRERDPV